MRAVFISLILSCLAISLSPLTFSDTGGFLSFISVVLALIFWIGLVTAFVLLGIISSHRKQRERIELRSRDNRRKRSKTKQKPGIIVFFSNIYASSADVIMLIAFIINLVIIIVPFNEKDSFTYITPVSVFIYSVIFHSILNGINFKYILSYKKDGGYKHETFK